MYGCCMEPFDFSLHPPILSNRHIQYVRHCINNADWLVDWKEEISLQPSRIVQQLRVRHLMLILFVIGLQS